MLPLISWSKSAELLFRHVCCMLMLLLQRQWSIVDELCQILFGCCGALSSGKLPVLSCGVSTCQLLKMMRRLASCCAGPLAAVLSLLQLIFKWLALLLAHLLLAEPALHPTGMFSHLQTWVVYSLAPFATCCVDAACLHIVWMQHVSMMHCNVTIYST